MESATGSIILAGRISQHPAQIQNQILLTPPTGFQIQLSNEEHQFLSTTRAVIELLVLPT
jgi:hypothetical protein